MVPRRNASPEGQGGLLNFSESACVSTRRWRLEDRTPDFHPKQTQYIISI